MTDFPLSITARLYRRLLALLPGRFHARHAHEMLDLFTELDAAAREEQGSLGAWHALGAEIPGLMRLALRERQGERFSGGTASVPHVRPA